MKIKDIRNTYNIIVNSQEEHLEVLTYLELLKELVAENGFTPNWNKICFNTNSNCWILLSEMAAPYKLPSITFNQLKDMLVEEKEWVPKIGDWIVITKSASNWISNMDEFVDNVVQITNNNKGSNIRFANDGSWSWQLSDGHFRKANPHEIPKEEVLLKDDLIEEAKKRYPVGTKFYPVHMAQKREYCIITDDTVFVKPSDIIYSEINGLVFNSNGDPKYGATTFNRTVYYKGKWADIVVEESTQCEEVNLVGRYLKALVDYPNNGNVKKGEYGIITDSTCIRADFPSQKNYACSSALTMPEIYELMPEGFNPNSISGTSKFKVGVWYKNTQDGDYGKLCSEVTTDRFPCTEYIDNRSFGYHDNGSYFAREWMDNLIEADLSEIQKYLPVGHPDKFGSSAYHVDFGDSNFPLPEVFVDTIINRAIMLSPSGIAYYFGSDPYKPDLDELKSSTIKLKTIEVRKLTTN